MAGIAILAAQIAAKILDDKAEGKKKKRGQQTQAAGREITESLTAPPPAPPSPTPPPFGPPGLSGQVYDPTALTRILGQQGVEVAPWEFPAWAGQPGRAEQLAGMGLPVGKEFVGMQGQVRKPIGAQERLDATLPQRKRKGDVGPEAALIAREGGQYAYPGGQIQQSSASSRRSDKEAVRTGKAKERQDVLEQSQEDELNRITGIGMNRPPGEPTPMIIRQRIAALGGQDALAKYETDRHQQLVREQDTTDRIQAEEGSGLLEQLKTWGPEDPRWQAGINKLYGLDMRADAEALQEDALDAEARGVEDAKQASLDAWEAVNEEALSGPISMELARDAYRDLQNAGDGSIPDQQYADKWLAWAPETDPEIRTRKRHILMGTTAAHDRERTLKRLEASLVQQIQSGALRDERMLMDTITEMAGDADVEVPPAMQERLLAMLTEIRENARKASETILPSDGSAPPTGAVSHTWPKLTPVGESKKKTRYKLGTGGTNKSRTSDISSSPIMWDLLSERAVEVQGVLKAGSNKVRDAEGNEYMRPRSKLEERPGLQFKASTGSPGVIREWLDEMIRRDAEKEED